VTPLPEDPVAKGPGLFVATGKKATKERLSGRVGNKQ